MAYVKIEIVQEDKDVECPPCNQALKISALDLKEFEIMKSLKAFNTNVGCPNCGVAFCVQLKDNKWRSSKTFLPS